MDQFILFIAAHPLLVGLFIALLIALLLLESKKGGKNLTSSELTYLVNKENAVIIDLRDQKKFNQGHIIHSLNIPQAQLKDRINELKKHQKSKLILVCMHGQHAGSAGQILTKEGFEIYRLRGGIQTWMSENLPLVKS